MTHLGKVLHSKGQKYSVPVNCEAHGDMMLVLRLHRNFDETWRAKRTLQPATEQLLSQYKTGLERGQNRPKSDKKRPRPRRRPRQSGTTQAENRQKTDTATKAAE
jgi:hypothetical protein